MWYIELFFFLQSTPTILQGYRREPTQAVVTEDKSRKQDQPTAEVQKGGEVQASEEKPREVRVPEVQASQETEDDKGMTWGRRVVWHSYKYHREGARATDKV